jgi:hypothetical protein
MLPSYDCVSRTTVRSLTRPRRPSDDGQEVLYIVAPLVQQPFIMLLDDQHKLPLELKVYFSVLAALVVLPNYVLQQRVTSCFLAESWFGYPPN